MTLCVLHVDVKCVVGQSVHCAKCKLARVKCSGMAKNSFITQMTGNILAWPGSETIQIVKLSAI